MTETVIPGTYITAFGMQDPVFDLIGYALFIFSGIIVFNFWAEMAFSTS